MVRRIAVDAGEIVLQYFDGASGPVEHKGDGSPVTLADRKAEAFIQKSLLSVAPEIPVIGEEAAEAGNLPDLKNAEYFWLVDPLDGTKEFIAGGEDFTVNIALVHGNAPVLGVVYAPATGTLYAGYGADSAVRWNRENDKDKSIHVRKPPNEGLTVAASLRHGDDKKLEKFLKEMKVEKILKRGSSLKICAIAEGKADIYPRLGPTCEWDTAAGDAVLRAAGGTITDIDGKPLAYGGRNPKFLNPPFVACSFAWFAKDAA